MIEKSEVQRRYDLWSQGYWEVPDNLDTTGFDFNWKPEPYDRPYTHQFGTQHQKTGGPRFVIPENEGIKYQNFQHAIRLPDINNRSWRPLVTNCTIDFSWHPDDTEPPFIYVFGNQWHDSHTMPTYQYRVKGATDKKYMTDVVATLLPNKDNWEIPSDVDDSMFDYSWVPNPHEPPMKHQFGTQWQKTNGPCYVVPGFTNTKYIDTMRVKKLPNMRNWRIIEPVNQDTFDFSWHPDDTDGNFTYVFGNKFYPPEVMPTIIYKNKNAITNKFSTEIKADLNIPTVIYEDNIFDKVVQTKFETSYVRFVKAYSEPNLSYITDERVDTLFPNHLNGDEAIIYKDAKKHIYDKLTDYPCIIHKSNNQNTLLDIVFLSNGEEIADSNYEHLLNITKDKQNRVIRIDGVNGRVASQHAAANASNTPWYFLINGKLRVNEQFDFSWQPDIYKSSRHYIFTATNPVNGLEYGHQAIVANNKKLTLGTIVRGLDFTMDSITEVININSGVGMYNTSVWDTWRTAFRECIKLVYAKDNESKHRLDIWRSVANGPFSEYSLRGATDAVEYYNSVNGDFNKLKLSYDWKWLHDRFTKIVEQN